MVPLKPRDIESPCQFIKQKLKIKQQVWINLVTELLQSLMKKMLLKPMKKNRHVSYIDKQIVWLS